MTINGSPHYASATAFRRALDDRLRQAATSRNRTFHELRREFVFQRFLSLLFAEPEQPWLVKGGVSLLVRLADARFSKDLDLLRIGGIPADRAISELTELTTPQAGDHLTFAVSGGVKQSRINPVVEVSVTAYIGAEYDRFRIDLATELHFVAAPERIRPTPVVDLPGLPAPPVVVLYPLADQIADKVCAMYERYGDVRAPSTRFRDLADLVRIVATSEVEATRLLAALRSEETRRGMQLPAEMIAPDPVWIAGYPGEARRARLDRRVPRSRGSAGQRRRAAVPAPVRRPRVGALDRGSGLVRVITHEQRRACAGKLDGRDDRLVKPTPRPA
jgi:predicted nucleotidyltransferase component of viral defense system